MCQSKKQPVPQGNYLSAIRHGDLVFTSGMTPRRNGKLISYGRIHAGSNLETHKEAVSVAVQNALIAAQNCLLENEHIAAVLQLNVFINADDSFLDHSKLADSASFILQETLGPTGIGSRAAIGVASLPSNAPVEITLTVSVAAN